MMIRNIFCLFLSLIIVVSMVTPSYAVYDPNAKHSKWFNDKIRAETIVKNSVEVKAQRTYPVAVVDPKTREILMKTKNQASSIKVVPAVNSVGKTLMKRVPAAVMTQAIIAIVGKGVDWLMDEENNGVKYKEPVITGEYVWSYYGKNYTTAGVAAACHARVMASPDNYVSSSFDDGWCIAVTATSNRYKFGETAIKIKNPDYGVEPEWKRIPINSVAQKVFDQSNAGDAAAKQVIADAALDMFEAGELDSQLETAAEPQQFGPNEYHPQDPALKEFINGSDGQPGSDGQDGSDGQSPNPSELPAFCSWASIVCDWIGWTKEAHKETQDAIAANTDEQAKTNEKLDKVTVTREDGQEAIAVEPPAFCDWASYVCDFIDWVQTEPDEPDDDGNIDVQVPDQDMHVPILERLYISMPAQCPADPVLEFMGGKIPFPMSIFCQFATMMKPLILLFAYIKGLSIIGNGLT